MQVLRTGNISSVNYEKGTAKITYEDRDGATTNEFPFLAWAYWMPKIGETVLVGHLASGSTAVILGPIWTDEHKPAAFGADLYRQEMSTTPGEAYAAYSSKSKTMDLKASTIQFTYGGGSTTVAAIMGAIADLQERCKAHGI